MRGKQTGQMRAADPEMGTKLLNAVDGAIARMDMIDNGGQRSGAVGGKRGRKT